MSSEISTSRNRLIAGLLILLAFFLVLCYFLISFLFRKPEQPKIGSHSPVDTLTYCSEDEQGLCIVAFSQVMDGEMQVNIQTPYTHFPEFILAINRDGQESTYACEPMENSAIGVVCTGASQPPGETLNFKVISKSLGTLLAEGNFSIIGIALLTQESPLTVTVEVTETVTETAIAPTFNTPTPVWTPSPNVTSYPNPTSYP